MLDAASSVLAVACESTEDERAVMAGEGGAESVDLRVAELPVGQLRYRPRGEPPPAALLRLVANLIGARGRPRARRPSGPARPPSATSSRTCSARRVTDRENIVARAGELGCDLSGGASVIVVRARPQQPEEGDWRARVLTVAERGARAVERASLAALAEAGWARHGSGPNEEPARAPSASS